MKSTYNINYKLPLNFKNDWAHLFKPDYKYKTVNLRVRELKNVFVSHYGLVIKNGLLAKGCAPNIGFAPFYDKSAYYKHWRKGIEQMLVCKYGKSLPSVTYNDNRKYLIIHSPWFSYYFWITECLPRLLMVKKQLANLTLLYPESWEKFSFVNETLSLFPELQIQKIPCGTHIFVKNLILPEVKPWTPMFIPEQVFEVRNLFYAAIENKKIVPPAQGNIYLSRKDASRKNFENEHAVSTVLSKYGFTNIAMSDYSIFEQVAIMKNTKNIFSITGAGMSNFMFLPENSTIFDITNKKYITHKQYKFHFWKLSNIIKSNYVVYFSDYANSPNVHHYSIQNLIPNIDELQILLKNYFHE